ncbi:MULTISPECIES: NirD/YgiW/YdeI family stress tolerance protein [Oceanimonas]|uniref:NirD/YgiW/YdeI family stress tolerance protein n=2 Tax=Oceanimonas TaxID=129577 RepID=A0ABW7P5H2_9GAMM|nr:NirD/YgiW/YdeI family stress tolerance protein [Oceanimonas sp. CAM02]MDV2857573.1 NirD/YgiW/YdeI family stress tolerance protein [Oceanimonas sp. CAM02]
MKKSLVVTLFAGTFSLLAGTTMAATGGFTGPDSTEQVSVSQALEMKDDSQVRLSGVITESLGDEKYRFQDDSGSMIVEIDNEDWGEVKATPDTPVTLWGEIDKDWNETELDVHRVELAP